MTRLPRRLATAVLALVTVVAAAVGCGGSDLAATALAAGSAWARPTPPGAENGVVYLTLTTDTSDAVVGATVAPSVARAVELHATTAEEAGGGHVHGGGGGNETLSMEQVESFPVEPGRALVFEPGGNHLMLVGLAAPLVRGQRIDLTLRLASGRDLEVAVAVADNAPR